MFHPSSLSALFLLSALTLAGSPVFAHMHGQDIPHEQTKESGECGPQQQQQFTPSPEALQGCLERLSQNDKHRALEILHDSLPEIQILDKRITKKMHELEALTYDSSLSPEALPELGIELQKLREQLRLALIAVNMRLLSEVGVNVSQPSGRGMNCMRGMIIIPNPDGSLPAGAVQAPASTPAQLQQPEAGGNPAAPQTPQETSIPCMKEEQHPRQEMMQAPEGDTPQQQAEKPRPDQASSAQNQKQPEEQDTPATPEATQK